MVKTGKLKYGVAHGFTLMEIIVSTILVALVLVGLTNLFVLGKTYILHAQYRVTGGELGRFFLEPLQMDVRQDQWGTNCLSSSTVPPPCPPAQTIGNIPYTPAYTIDNVTGTTLRRVKVTISWSEPTT